MRVIDELVNRLGGQRKFLTKEESLKWAKVLGISIKEGRGGIKIGNVEVMLSAAVNTESRYNYRGKTENHDVQGYVWAVIIEEA